MATALIHELFDGWLQRSPDRVFLHLGDASGSAATMTYAQVGAIVDALEVELLSAGACWAITSIRSPPVPALVRWLIWNCG